MKGRRGGERVEGYVAVSKSKCHSSMVGGGASGLWGVGAGEWRQELLQELPDEPFLFSLPLPQPEQAPSVG